MAGTWRVIYRIDRDAIVILEVFAKKTGGSPTPVIETCRKRHIYTGLEHDGVGGTAIIRVLPHFRATERLPGFQKDVVKSLTRASLPSTTSYSPATMTSR
jgi:hypothetical protein